MEYTSQVQIVISSDMGECLPYEVKFNSQI